MSNTIQFNYYTPCIEELHIGFECELLYQADNKMARTENYKWHPVLLDKNNFQKAHSLIRDKKIRVRVLSMTDIEDFGFTLLTGLNDDGGFFNDKDNWHILLSPKYTQRQVYLRSLHIYSNTNHMTNTVFLGFVKNKSELKRIFFQVGVLGEAL